MIKIIVIILSASSLFSLENYSGGVLSKNQEALDVTFYDLNIKVDPNKQIISGHVVISFNLISQPKKFEFDLINSFSVSEVSINEMTLSFVHKNNKIFISNPGFDIKKPCEAIIKYSGPPPIAKKPPWSGGFSWESSKDGRPWIAVSCQTNGAHIWYPCKEHPSDKSDNGAKISITVPEPLTVASNGLLTTIKSTKDHWNTWVWETKYPISTYNVNFTAGNFKRIEKKIYLLDEPLNLVFYVLPESIKGAQKLLNDAEEYLIFYANHFGQYPWIDEKFGLVETPYWGMEHQTINAYGNKYNNTQLGYDFLMFHEMGHEWWGNYLSVTDWSDFWIHEGFDTYAEAIFVEEKYGKKALRGFIKTRYKKNIQNVKPVVLETNATMGDKTGTDIYYKGAHTLHMLRYLIGFDLLKETLKEFIHMPKEKANNQTSTKEFIYLIHQNTNKNIDWFFDQYLYKSQLPTLSIKKEVKKNKQFLEFWWEEESFKMPIEIRFNSFDGERNRTLDLSSSSLKIAIPLDSKLLIDPDNWLLFNKNIIN